MRFAERTPQSAISRYNPLVDLNPANSPDYLAGSVLAQLGRPSENRKAWNAFRSLLFSFLTFGLLPLIVIVRRHGRQAGREQENLWHLAEWMRTTGGHRDAGRLIDASNRPGPIRPLLTVASASLLAAALVLIFAPIDPPGVGRLHFLLDSTFGYLRHSDNFATLSPAGRFFLLWTGLLTLASLALYIHIQWHAWQTRRFVRIFNDFAEREGLSGFDPPAPGLGLRPGFVLAALALLLAGAPWGVPAMLAAGLYRSHCDTGRLLRQRLAERLRGMLLNRRPEMLVPRPIWTQAICSTDRCRLPLPREAAYCPRCGTRCAGLDLVA